MTTARVCLAALLSASTLLTACDPNPKSWKTPNMTALSPRLQPLFDKTKTVCFGRFLIDVPETVEVVWGSADVPLGVSVYPNGIDHVKALAQAEIVSLNSEKAIHHAYQPLLISRDETTQPPGIIVTGYESFDAIAGLKINGYFAMDSYGVVVDSRPLQENKDRATATILDIARRMRPRAEAEIPSDPGVCLDHAFLPDKPDPAPEKPEGEHIRVGFRLKEFPDAHLSIYTAPANPHASESNTLKYQLQRMEDDATKAGRKDQFLKLKFLRRDTRQIHDWQAGFEALSRTPDEEKSHSHHDFVMDFQGVPDNLFKPYADIRFSTGVDHDAAGATKPSLTDEEAVAVWDKLTSSIRVRKASDAPAKRVSAAEPPKAPLGELVATGRACPQPGWWECAEEARPVQGGRRQFFRGGDRMPHAMLQGVPSVWQRLKGDAPLYRVATVWKLVDYDTPPAPPAAAEPPACADAPGTTPDKPASPDESKGEGNDTPPSTPA